MIIWYDILYGGDGCDNGCNLKSRPWILSSLFSHPDSCPQWWSSRRFPAISFPTGLSFVVEKKMWEILLNLIELKKKIVNKTQSEAPILWSSFATFSLLTGEVCKMQVRTWQFAAHQKNLFWKSYKLGPVDNSVVTSSAIEALWCFWRWYFYACKTNKDILFNISSILLIYLLDWGRCHLVGYLVWEVHQHKPGNSWHQTEDCCQTT